MKRVYRNIKETQRENEQKKTYHMISIYLQPSMKFSHFTHDHDKNNHRIYARILIHCGIVSFACWHQQPHTYITKFVNLTYIWARSLLWTIFITSIKYKNTKKTKNSLLVQYASGLSHFAKTDEGKKKKDK